MIRVNNAKNFKGKSYVVADKLDSLIQSLTLNGVDIGSATAHSDLWKVNFTTADGGATNTSAVDLTAIKDYIDNKAINVAAGAGIAIDTTNVLNPKISADVDGTTIVLSGEGDAAVLKADLKIVKKTQPNTGYAASYYLAYGDDTNAIGEEINIVKDQFIKSATFGWSTAADSTGAGWTTTKSDTAKYPCIKIEVYVNENGVSTDDTLVQSLYIPLAETFQEYTAQNGVEIVSASVIQGVVDTATSEKVYTAAGTSAAVLSVGTSGFKVANIQAAIDNAVTAEHNAASAAIEDLEGDVLSFESATSAAVDTLNSCVVAVAGNAQTAISNAVDNLTSQIAGVVTNADTATKALGAAIDSLDNNVSAAIEDVNTKVEGAIDSVVGNVNTALTGTVTSVNGAISSTVTAVNTNVGNAITAVSGVIDNVQTAVGNAITAVSGVIDNAQTAVGEFKDSVNTTISAVVDDVNEAISANIASRSAQLTSAIVVGKIEATPTETDTAGIYTTTVSAAYILGVFGADKLQIYPEIKEGTTTGTFELTADYGATQSSAEAWTIIAAQDLPALGTTATATTATASYTPAGTTAAAYASQTNGVSYSNATAIDATATATADVDAADASYTQIADVANTGVADGTYGGKATTVANGDAATAPAADAAVEKQVPSYKNA